MPMAMNEVGFTGPSGSEAGQAAFQAVLPEVSVLPPGAASHVTLDVVAAATAVIHRLTQLERPAFVDELRHVSIIRFDVFGPCAFGPGPARAVRTLYRHP